MSTKEQAAEYYKKNKEEVLRKIREKYQKNKKEERAYQKKYYEENKESILKKYHEKVNSMKNGWTGMSNPPKENGLYQVRLHNGLVDNYLFSNGVWSLEDKDLNRERSDPFKKYVNNLLQNSNHRATWWRKV